MDTASTGAKDTATQVEKMQVEIPKVSPAENNPSEIDDLLFSSFYPLNKSSSEFVKVGIDFDGEQFRPVIRVTTNSMRYLQLSMYQWESLQQCFEIIDAYFGDDQQFQNLGRPTKLYLEGFDIALATSYSKKSIIIEERPSDCKARNGKKFKQILGVKSVIMHEVTYEGLKLIKHCVEKKVDQLNTLVALTEKIISVIDSQFQGSEKIVENYYQLKKHFTSNADNLLQFLLENIPEWNPATVALGFHEIIAFKFKNFAKHVNQKFSKKDESVNL